VGFKDEVSEKNLKATGSDSHDEVRKSTKSPSCDRHLYVTFVVGKFALGQVNPLQIVILPTLQHTYLRPNYQGTLSHPILTY
jgi:hypothetical protein